MPKLPVTIIKGSLIGMLSLLFTQCGPGNTEDQQNPALGNYSLYAKGVERLQLHGDIIYELVQEEKEYGPQTVLKLHLSNASEDNAHYLGFIVASPVNGPELKSYKVNGNIDCFLSKFKGVFAFASINILGEHPFFAKKGKLFIESKADDVLMGRISVTMENSSGKTLDIHGDFNAVNKESTFNKGGRIGQAL